VDGIDRAIPLHDGAPNTAYDVDIEVMELGHALSATPKLISGRVPYLSGTRSRKFSGSSLQSPLSVGLVWEAGNWDRRCRAPPQMLSRITAGTGVRLASLQQGPGRRMAATVPAEDIATPRPRIAGDSDYEPRSDHYCRHDGGAPCRSSRCARLDNASRRLRLAMAKNGSTVDLVSDHEIVSSNCAWRVEQRH
jgi:hypothetical protein